MLGYRSGYVCYFVSNFMAGQPEISFFLMIVGSTFQWPQVHCSTFVHVIAEDA